MRRVFLRRRQTSVERGVPAATVEGLRARGHDVVVAPLPWAAAQAIRIDWERGVLIGGSDPRKDGCAIGLLNPAARVPTRAATSS